jgi:eukaryotic-like serine/threonine-protein kinase
MLGTMSVDPSAATEAGAGGTAAPELAPGASVGKYRLDRVLGAGGMGVVWAAFDPDLERAVAIKLLRSIDSAAALRTRLLREARAMARLKHPNILTVYEVGTDRNRDYIAMELIDGADLDGWLASRPPRGEIFAALFAAGRGLAAAHDAGLIHRDLKPHNILRGRDGSVYVTDFGLARGQIDDGAEVVQEPIAVGATAAGAAATGAAATGAVGAVAVGAVAIGSYPRIIDSVMDMPLTQTGVLIGTPAYMAPEQFAGRTPDPRSDQFAFCVTAWEALTGARPFAGKTLDELRAAAGAGVSGGGADLPPRIRGVLARGLAPDPAARWPDMRALLHALEAALAPVRRSRRPLFVAVALGTAAISAGVMLATSEDGASAELDCASPAEAFGSAWSVERRRAVSAQHGGREAMIVTALLDEVRRDWIKTFESTCAAPASAARKATLACLSEVRQEIDEVTRELGAEVSELSMTAVIPLKIAIDSCGGSEPDD